MTRNETARYFALIGPTGDIVGHAEGFKYLFRRVFIHPKFMNLRKKKEFLKNRKMIKKDVLSSI